MCGIFGVLNLYQELDLDEHQFRSALTTLRHRGPDAENLQRFGNRAILGHTRLSIIDLSEENNQPLSILDRYWIVYNGEIFNYLELRKELEEQGAQFRTSGDTEVLLYAYALWGETCVTRFNGMWAFAIYDTQEKTLFCSRDRFGIKPFNYTINNGQFLFASEIKAILAYRPDLAQPEYNAISNYCRTSVGAQNPQTWFKNILRLSPGHNMTISNGDIRTARYWTYPNDIDRNIKFEEAREHYAELFKDAVRLQMRSDVPLGLTLSAGIDSSSIAYVMHANDPAPHHCFTSRFNSQDGLETDTSIYTQKTAIDESISALKVAGQLNLHSHVVDTDYGDMVSSLSSAIYHLESGHSSPAVIPLMQLMGQAKRNVKVLLEGQGADELLGGYIINLLWPAIMDLLASGRINEALLSLRAYAQTYKINYAIKMTLRHLSNKFSLLTRTHQWVTGINNVFGPALREYTRQKDYMQVDGEGGRGWLAQILLHQHAGGLINLLHYGDALSMAHSIEARVPFMDYRLVEFVWRLPPEFKVNLGIGKYLHRQAMRKTVPDSILDQKVKFGFNTPISQQFLSNKTDVESPVDVLLSERCLSRGLFDPASLRSLIDKHRAGHHDHSPLLFRLLSVELWFRQFIDTPIPSVTKQAASQADLHGHAKDISIAP